MPEVQRPDPPYRQIAMHYQQLIERGDLREGQRLPTINAIADEWKVSKATAGNAITALQRGGYVWSSQQGTYVTATHGTTPTSRDRVLALRRGASARTEQTRLLDAGIVSAPSYVARLFDIDEGADIIRREWITTAARRATRLSVSWYPAELAESVPALLSTAPVPEDPIQWIEARTDRRALRGSDHLRGREADLREAQAIGVSVGDAILAGVHVWSDDRGIVEYGEWVVPADAVVSYEYDITVPDGAPTA